MRRTGPTWPLAVFDRVVRPFARVWFRYEVSGLERIPEPPCLFVGNHSGLGLAEVLCMIAAWRERFGDARPIHGLAHDFLFKVPLLRQGVAAIGALPASRKNARAALERGEDVVVFPGGELDAARPFWQAREVHFGRRCGYAKLALETGVPLVPVVTIGSHLTYIMLPGGALLARGLGLKKRLRVERIPLPAGIVLGAGALAFDATLGVALLALGAIPNPLPIRIELLPPVAKKRDESIDELHARVHGTIARRVKGAQQGDRREHRGAEQGDRREHRGAQQGDRREHRGAQQGDRREHRGAEQGDRREHRGAEQGDRREHRGAIRRAA